MNYELLKWDTDFFDFKTGRIIPSVRTQSALALILEKMRTEGFQLVYWASEREIVFPVDEFSGRLVDRKTTFSINIDNLKLNRLPPPISKPYRKTMSYERLENLALQSGELSRFAVDPDFLHDKFTALYKTWIAKSVSGEMADEVLVIHMDKTMAGMVTLSLADQVGSIGLIAVDTQFRGNKLGKQLIWDALRWFKSSGCHTAEVITQGDNSAACHLYESCGLQQVDIKYFYHFWPQKSQE